MQPEAERDPAARHRFLVSVLAVLGVWTVATPYVARAAGLRLGVSSDLEIVDHVVPGALIAGAAVVAPAAWRRATTATAVPVAAFGIAFLAAAWVTSTHVPLLVDAARGLVGWGPALVHSSGGAPALIVALLLFVPALREPVSERTH